MSKRIHLYFPGHFPVYFFWVINLPPSGLKLYNFGRYFRQQTVNIPHSVLQLFCYLFCVRKENPKITDKGRIFLPRGIFAVSIHHTGENLCRSAPRGISINVRNRDWKMPRGWETSPPSCMPVSCGEIFPVWCINFCTLLLAVGSWRAFQREKI